MVSFLTWAVFETTPYKNCFNTIAFMVKYFVYYIVRTYEHKHV